MQSEKRSRSWAIPLVLWLAPAIAFSIVLPVSLLADRSSVAAQGGPSNVAVGERVRDLRESVNAQVTVASARNVTASVSGTVTSLAVQVGASISQGQTLLGVDGVQLVAEVGGTPLYRPLKQGDHGPDVAALNSLLAARGYPVHSDSTAYDRSTAVAVRQFRLAIGSSAAYTFDPSLVAYFPSGAVVSAVSADVGTSIAPGSAIFQLQGSVTKVELTSTGDSTSLSAFGTAPVTLSAGTSKINLESASASSDADKVALNGFVRDRLADGTLKVDSSGQATGLTLFLRTPDRVGTVPISAVYSTTTGHLCVFVRSGSKLAAQRIVKPIPSSEVGVAYVDPRLIGRKVLSNASTLTSSERRLCT